MSNHKSDGTNDDEIDAKKDNVQILVVVRHVNTWPIVVVVKMMQIVLRCHLLI